MNESELPFDREDLRTIMFFLADIAVDVKAIRKLLEEDDAEEADS